MATKQEVQRAAVKRYGKNAYIEWGKNPSTPAAREAARKAIAEAKQRNAPLKRVSDKRKKHMAKVGPERRARKEEIGCCMVCRQLFTPECLDGDEVARGPAREKCLSEPSLTIIDCRRCHEVIQDWPIAKRLAVIERWEADQRAARYCELTGNAPTHVTGADVVSYMTFFKPGPVKRKRRSKLKA